jgi:hypothetical protein
MNPSVEESNIVEILHSVLCNKNHSNGECSFYDELSLSTKWEMPSHKLWLGITRRIMNKFDLTAEQLMDEISKCLSFLSSLDPTPGSFRSKFIADILTGTSTVVDS